MVGVRRLAAVFLLALTSCSPSVTGDGSTSTSEVSVIATSTSAPAGATTTSTPAGWVELAAMEVARSEHPAAVLGGEIVVLGGFVETGVGRTDITPTVEAYTPDTDTWRQLTELPEPRHHGMAAAVGERLFFIGGSAPSGESSSAMWELVEGTWMPKAPLTAAVAAAAAVVLSDTIYVVGGVPDGYLQAYDVAGDQWTILPAPPTQREHVAAAIFDGEVWAIAGRWMGEIFNTTEIYDPEAQAWRAGPPLVEPRSGFGAAAVGDMIVVAGGEVFDPDEALTSVEALDGEAWRLIDPLPHGLHGSPLVVIDDQVYLPGGSTRPAGVANDGAMYRLDAG
jgi:N-acetylneuraminic acid mutarotase